MKTQPHFEMKKKQREFMSNLFQTLDGSNLNLVHSCDFCAFKVYKNFINIAKICKADPRAKIINFR